MDESVKQEAKAQEILPDDADEKKAEEATAENPEEEAPAAENDATTTDSDGEGVELARELVERTKERDALQDQLLRAKADFDNYRKRTLRDMERTRKTAAESLFRHLLPVLDNLERAYQHVENPDDGLAQGVGMVITQFHEVLSAQGIEAIPATGEAFDPNVHEALSQMPSVDHAENVIIEEYERGYRLHGYVLRPAKVIVSSGPPESTETPAAGEDA